MEVSIHATPPSICTEFMKDGTAKKAEISVVISPLKVTVSSDESSMQVVTGCNFWRSCHNAGCWYSIAARETKKAQAGK